MQLILSVHNCSVLIHYKDNVYIMFICGFTSSSSDDISGFTRFGYLFRVLVTFLGSTFPLFFTLFFGNLVGPQEVPAFLVFVHFLTAKKWATRITGGMRIKPIS
jgi:hypothetical protein